MLKSAPVRKGHERLQRLDHRARVVAGFVAVALHVALFAFMPGIAISGTSRMTLVVGEWSGPVTQPDQRSGYAPLSGSDTVPVLANGPFVLHRVPKLYPPDLWRHREPSSARLEVAIDPTGRVRHAALIDGADGAGEAALVALTQLMRFRVAGLNVGPKGIVATVQVGVVATREVIVD